MLRSANRGNILRGHPTRSRDEWKKYTVRPEEGSSIAHHCYAWGKRWGTASCTHSWSCASTRPPAVLSLSSPPSCTAAAGSSSVAYSDGPPGRACGQPRKSAAEEPSQFPALATQNPVTELKNFLCLVQTHKSVLFFCFFLLSFLSQRQ